MFVFQKCDVQNRSASSRTISLAKLVVEQLLLHRAPAVQAATFLIRSTWFPWLIQDQRQLLHQHRLKQRHLHQRQNLLNSLAFALRSIQRISDNAQYNDTQVVRAEF
jgi:hypothetical protein